MGLPPGTNARCQNRTKTGNDKEDIKMTGKMKILIVGGGASGMMAAITAARYGADVTILEHNDRLGKKLLVTGNGKCNFTNLKISADYYYSDSEDEQIDAVLSQCGVQNVLDLFLELGILPKEKRGMIYPYSEQASAVLDVLRFQVASMNIRVRLEEQISSIAYNGKFAVTTNHEQLTADRLILACGSKAAPKTGSDGSGYAYAQQFGHSIVPVVPALVQLYGDHKMFREVAGVRCDASITLSVNEEECACERGELQLTDYGLSGIPIFQISRVASRALYRNNRVQASIHFLPDYTPDTIFQLLTKRAVQHSDYTLEQLLIGIFPKKLGNALIKSFGWSVNTKAMTCKASEWKSFSEFICSVKIPIVGTKGFDCGQVCAGGVSLNEVSMHSLESKLQKGLYFAGEILDVDGICGGYNLHWAWASGITAGKHAASDHPIDTLI